MFIKTLTTTTSIRFNYYDQIKRKKEKILFLSFSLSTLTDSWKFDASVHCLYWVCMALIDLCVCIFVYWNQINVDEAIGDHRHWPTTTRMRLNEWIMLGVNKLFHSIQYILIINSRIVVESICFLDFFNSKFLLAKLWHLHTWHTHTSFYVGCDIFWYLIFGFFISFHFLF